MTRILFVCHGNICRSPMAEFVMKDLVKKAGLESEFVIASAATSTEEIGNRVHHGTRGKLHQMGIPCGDHRARQICRADYDRYDYLIGMDSMNIRNMLRMTEGEMLENGGKIVKLLSFTDCPRDVADPWYTGDFRKTYEDICEGLSGFLQYLGYE